MNAVCPRCRTTYLIPDEVLSPKGLPVKCTNCQEIFKVYPEPASSSAPTAKPVPEKKVPLPSPEPKPVTVTREAKASAPKPIHTKTAPKSQIKSGSQKSAVNPPSGQEASVTKDKPKPIRPEIEKSKTEIKPIEVPPPPKPEIKPALTPPAPTPPAPPSPAPMHVSASQTDKVQSKEADEEERRFKAETYVRPRLKLSTPTSESPSDEKETLLEEEINEFEKPQPKKKKEKLSLDFESEEEDLELELRSLPKTTKIILFAISLLAIVVVVIGLFVFKPRPPGKTSGVKPTAQPATVANKAPEPARTPSPQDLFQKAIEFAKPETKDGLQKTEETLVKLIEVEPNFPNAKATLAETRVMLGRINNDSSKIDEGCKDAEGVVQETISIETKKPAASAEKALATCNWGKGKLNEAEKALKEAMTIQDSSITDQSTFYLLLARIYLDKKDIAKAISAVENSLKINGLSFSGNHILAKIYAVKSDWANAVKFEEAALSIIKDHPEATANLQDYKNHLEGKAETPSPSEVATKTGEKKEGEEGNYDELMKKAKAARHSGNNQAALKYLNEALKAKPGSGDAKLLMGWAYLDMGDYSKAEEIFSSMKSGSAYYGLGSLYQSQGKKAQAIQAYEHYLSVAPNGHEAEEVRSILENLKGG